MVERGRFACIETGGLGPRFYSVPKMGTPATADSCGETTVVDEDVAAVWLRAPRRRVCTTRRRWRELLIRRFLTTMAVGTACPLASSPDARRVDAGWRASA